MLKAITPASLLWAALTFFGFLFVVAVGSVLLPGRAEAIHPTAAGHHRINGLLLFIVIGFLTTLLALGGVVRLSGIHSHFFPLFLVANIFAFLLACFVCFPGSRSGIKGSGGGGFKARLKTFYYGAHRNPSFAGIDLKMFSYRPSLIGLGLINASFATAQYERYGFITERMWLFQFFYFIYLLNYFHFEEGMLQTWDVIEERFGWMLIWGDYVLVPFFYSIAGWWLMDQMESLPIGLGAFLLFLYLFGFWLFRGANQQKHAFKKNPSAMIWGRPAATIEGKLLISGFWGIGRKLNYTGELCLYLAWTLLCGFSSPWPYLLPLWLALLFMHRAWRDDKKCRAKYGPSWAEYCLHAKFRMIPLIY